MRDLIDHPQLSERARWREVDTAAGPVRAVLPPMTFTDVELPMGPVPALGEHTDAVLSELGLTDTAIAGLRTGGAVG
jgi:formyl-CoA transferase